MKKHIPNAFTLLNLMVGLYGIIIITGTNSYLIAIYFVIICGLLDFFDGLLARLLNAKSELGAQLDSFADLISFGALPVVALVKAEPILDFGPLVMLGFLLIGAFSALRLAKFNLSTDQTEEFKGLPTPANALMITTFLYSDFLEGLVQWHLVVGSLLICFLLVSNIRLVAFKFQSYGLRQNSHKYFVLLLVAGGFMLFQWSFLPFVIPTYIAASIVGNYLIKPRL